MNELTLNATLQYQDVDGTADSMSLSDLLATVSTLRLQRGKMLVTHSAEVAIALGSASSPGWAIFINRDAVNFINLKVATSAAIFAKLKPGEFAFLRLGSGAQVPYAQADTGDCVMEYLIAAT